MTDITLSFSDEMIKALIERRKMCTTRSKVKGKPGDRFPVAGEWWKIVDVVTLPLWQIAGTLYLLEGFLSPADFTRYWDSLSDYPSFRFARNTHYPVHFIIPTGEART